MTIRIRLQALSLMLALGLIAWPSALATGGQLEEPANNTPMNIKGCSVTRPVSLPKDTARVMDSVVIVQNGDQIGSGVMVSEAGFILTAAHVVNGAKAVAVYLNSGETVPGQVMRVKPEQDVALVKIAGGHFHCLPLQRKAPIIGSDVFGIGVSLARGLTFRVTQAKVNGYRTAPDGPTYLQTDANLMPGNSGGPLLNRHGEVVGIVSWKMTRKDANALSFGTPANTVEQAMRIVLR